MIRVWEQDMHQGLGPGQQEQKDSHTVTTSLGVQYLPICCSESTSLWPERAQGPQDV